MPSTRRHALTRMAAGFGSVGLAGLLAHDNPPHFAPQAKRIIYLVLNGGLSQIDSFDPKPMVDKYDGQAMPGVLPKTESSLGNLMRSPFAFARHGQSGIPVSEIFPRIAARIDDFCVIRSMHTEVPNHEPSLFMMNSGAIQPGRPSMGAWVTYGLPISFRTAFGSFDIDPAHLTIPSGSAAATMIVFACTSIPTCHTHSFFMSNRLLACSFRRF